MKTFKRIKAMLLAAIMAVMTFSSTTAFAAESTSTDVAVPVVTEDARVIRAIEINKDYANISTTSSAAGKSFISTSNELELELKYSKANTIVALRLHDQTTGQFVGEWQTSSGSIDTFVGVTKGHRYICEYLVASGSGTVLVTNTVYAVFRE